MARHGARARRGRRSLFPAGARSVRDLSRVGRPRLHGRSTSPASGARSLGFFTTRQARYGTLAGVERPHRARHPGRHQLHRQAAEQALGPDGEQAVQPVGPEPQLSSPSSMRRSTVRVFDQDIELPAVSRSAEGIRVRVEAGEDRIHRPRQEAGRRAAEQGRAVRHDRSSTTRAAPSASRPTPNRTSPTPSSRSCPGQQKKIYFTDGHGEKDTASSERDGYDTIVAGARPRELHDREAGARAEGRRPRRCHGGGRRRSEDRLLPAGNRCAEAVPREERQAAAAARSAGQRRTARR